jgi:MOSC domain-containing protein YiiM
MMGEVRMLFRKPSSKKPMLSESILEVVEDKGIIGDKSFGSLKRQVLLVEEEILNKYGLSPGDLRENIVTSNIDLASLGRDTILEIGEVTLEITGDCAPCSYIDELREGLQEEIRGTRGVLAVIRSGSKLQVGDTIKVVVS